MHERHKWDHAILFSYETMINMRHKAWFPYGRKHVVTVVQIDSFSISTTFTTLLRHIHDYMETRLNRTYGKCLGFLHGLKRFQTIFDCW